MSGKENINNAKQIQVEALSDEMVVDYLRTHPEFFNRNRSVVSELKIPHDAGDAVSLIEHQIELLREKNKGLEQKIVSLVQIAQDNEQLEQQLHRIAQELISTDVSDEGLSAIVTMLETEFPSLQVRIGLDSSRVESRFSASHLLSENEFDVKAVKQIVIDNHRACLFVRGAQAKALSHEGQEAESAAVIPLRSENNFGALILGSNNADRFYEGMGTLFLDHLGELLSKKLKCLLVA